jgi:hypothetical protein
VPENKMLSRERMLRTIGYKETDYIPLSFMIFSFLKERCSDEIEFLEKQLELGLDVVVQLPELPFRFHPEVRTKEWVENSKGREPLLHKVYMTPEGPLTAVVRKTEDWPYGNSVPLLNDYLTPRSEKFLIETEEDVNRVKYLFYGPSSDDITLFKEESKRLKKFADEKGLLITGGWRSGAKEKGINRDGGTMGADALFWLCGGEQSILMAMDVPERIERILRIIFNWNIERMKVYLEEGIDMLVRRAWYEGTDLWSPSLYRRLFFPFLKKEVDVVHQVDTKFGYIMTTGASGLLEELLMSEIDVLIGLDPMMSKDTDLKKFKELLNKKISLWGGVNGFTVENGTKSEVEDATRQAVSVLGDGGGFILSPVDNVRFGTSHTWDNIKTMIEVWKTERGKNV